MPLSTLYALVSTISLLLHVHVTWKIIIPALASDASSTFAQVAEQLGETLSSHPAQSSIGWDVVWTSISFLVWSILTARDEGEGYLGYVLGIVVTPILSAAALAPYVFRRRLIRTDKTQKTL